MIIQPFSNLFYCCHRTYISLCNMQGYFGRFLQIPAEGVLNSVSLSNNLSKSEMRLGWHSWKDSQSSSWWSGMASMISSSFSRQPQTTPPPQYVSEFYYRSVSSWRFPCFFSFSKMEGYLPKNLQSVYSELLVDHWSCLRLMVGSARVCKGRRRPHLLILGWLRFPGGTSPTRELAVLRLPCPGTDHSPCLSGWFSLEAWELQGSRPYLTELIWYSWVRIIVASGILI